MSSTFSSLVVHQELSRRHWAACAWSSCWSCNQCWASGSGHEPCLHLVVNASGLLSVLLDLDIVVRLVLDELLGFLLDDLGFHQGFEGDQDAREKAWGVSFRLDVTSLLKFNFFLSLEARVTLTVFFIYWLTLQIQSTFGPVPDQGQQLSVMELHLSLPCHWTHLSTWAIACCFQGCAFMGSWIRRDVVRTSTRHPKWQLKHLTKCVPLLISLVCLAF